MLMFCNLARPEHTLIEKQTKMKLEKKEDSFKFKGIFQKVKGMVDFQGLFKDFQGVNLNSRGCADPVDSGMSLSLLFCKA